MKEHYKKLKLTHANLNRPVHLVLGTVCMYHWAPKDSCTYVYTPSGICPVTETVEEIDGLLDQLTNGGSNEQQSK